MNGDDVAAREAALVRRVGNLADEWPPCLEAFRAGWDTAQQAPPLPWLYRTFAPVIAKAHRAGRRAARAYARTRDGGAPAKEDNDGND